MEKINGGVLPSIFWCVVFALFMFSFSMIYIDFAQFVMPNKTVVQSSTKKYGYSTIEIPLHPSSLLDHISPSSVENNGEEEDRSRNISFSTNTEENVSDFLVDEQQTKAEVVNNVENRDEYVDMDIDTGNKFEPVSDPCLGKYVYVHNLPRKFNIDLLKDCQALCQWSDMCLSLSNEGLGPSIENSQGVFLDKGWFATDQFALEVIFHNRMKQYKCQTKNSSLASAIYVPFYAGLDISRYLWGGFNTSIRDSTSHELLRWLASRPEWQRLGGRDHFLVGGRIAWDFRRMTDNDSDWGNNLLVMPDLKNMSMLLIESSPYYGNEVAIPYPTYFHPSTDDDVLQWQERMRRQKKRHLFSFAGAPRPQYLESIRGCIIQQCKASSRGCKLLDCSKSSKNVCHDPSNVMKLFQDSIFCLQPPGDSFTRRSAFDSILAGCIPVFFHPASAYTQYIWYLPQPYTKYSVFIPEDQIRNGTANIEQILARIPKRQVKAMRKEVIKLIPKVIYADPKSRLETLEDAFDIAVKGIIQRVDEARQKENNMNAILDFGTNKEESKSR